VIPAIGINSWSALASIRVVGSSTGRCDRHPMRARERAPSPPGSGEWPLVPVGMHRWVDLSGRGRV
jgi:hypothetical protein